MYTPEDGPRSVETRRSSNALIVKETVLNCRAFVDIFLYSDTSESELNPFQNPDRVPRQFFPFKIIETGLIRSWVPRTRIFKIILTVNTMDFKVKY